MGGFQGNPTQNGWSLGQSHTKWMVIRAIPWKWVVVRSIPPENGWLLSKDWNNSITQKGSCAAGHQHNFNIPISSIGCRCQRLGNISNELFYGQDNIHYGEHICHIHKWISSMFGNKQQNILYSCLRSKVLDMFILAVLCIMDKKHIANWFCK